MAFPCPLQAPSDPLQLSIALKQQATALALGPTHNPSYVTATRTAGRTHSARRRAIRPPTDACEWKVRGGIREVAPVRTPGQRVEHDAHRQKSKGDWRRAGALAQSD